MLLPELLIWGLAQNLQPVPYFVKKQFELFASWLQYYNKQRHIWKPHQATTLLCSFAKDMIQVRGMLGLRHAWNWKDSPDVDNSCICQHLKDGCTLQQFGAHKWQTNDMKRTASHLNTAIGHGMMLVGPTGGGKTCCYRSFGPKRPDMRLPLTPLCYLFYML